MKKTAKYMTILVLFATLTTAYVTAHCQIPCGIYDDQARVNLMYEHVKTIAKSMKQIEAGQNANQSARWVLNKENHADELIDIASNYFLAQRIKSSAPNYVDQLKTAPPMASTVPQSAGLLSARVDFGVVYAVVVCLLIPLAAFVVVNIRQARKFREKLYPRVREEV